MFRYRFLITTLVLLSLSVVAPARARTTERCFPETGQCISGPLRAYWERNGGLPVFGYPITAQRVEVVEGSWAGPVQWFERDRLEDHSNDRQGVLAGRLGARFLELQGSPWMRGPGDSSTTTCTAFSQTGYSVCGAFRDYWQRSGGLERFGYPITDVRDETVEGRTYSVQYFERRRMELHPENRGTRNEILLGLLGRDVYSGGGGGLVITPPPGDVSTVIQQPILDAAYAAIQATNRQARLAVGLIDVVGEYAAALATPFGQRPIFVYVQRRADVWQVVEATSTPSATTLRQRGFPEELLRASDRSAVIDRALGQLQDPRSQGLNGYATRPRVADDWARLWVVPDVTVPLDPATHFLRRVGGEWRSETAGSVFTEDQLRKMGVPRELWPYGEGVHGPQSW